MIKVFNSPECSFVRFNCRRDSFVPSKFLRQFHKGQGRTASRGRIADNPNMENVHISFSVWVYGKQFTITTNSTY